MRFANRMLVALTLCTLAGGCASLRAPKSAPPAAAKTAEAESKAQPATAAKKPVPAPEPPVSPALQREWNEAQAHVRAGRTKEAEQAFLALTRKAPELSGPYASLGLLFQRAGRNTEAIAALEKAIEVNPRRAVYYNELGIVYRREGKFDVARKQYRKALDVDPDYAPAHLNLAILYDLYLQEPKEALPHYQRYRELVPAEAGTVSKWIIDLERRLQGGAKQNGGKG